MKRGEEWVFLKDLFCSWLGDLKHFIFPFRLFPALVRTQAELRILGLQLELIVLFPSGFPLHIAPHLLPST